MDTDHRIVRLRITGLVQGVGYRAFVQDQALRLGLTGWVRNRRDGNVEALVAGPADRLGELIVACRRGPAGSAVEAVETAAAVAEALGEQRPGAPFTIRATG